MSFSDILDNIRACFGSDAELHIYSNGDGCITTPDETIYFNGVSGLEQLLEETDKTSLPEEF